MAIDSLAVQRWMRALDDIYTGNVDSFILQHNLSSAVQGTRIDWRRGADREMPRISAAQISALTLPWQLTISVFNVEANPIQSSVCRWRHSKFAVAAFLFTVDHFKFNPILFSICWPILPIGSRSSPFLTISNSIQFNFDCFTNSFSLFKFVKFKLVWQIQFNPVSILWRIHSIH